jgi:hypothetical protein
MAWHGLTVLARRGMVWEHALLLPDETWIGGGHGHERMHALHIGRRGAERITTLHAADGAQLADITTTYSVEGPTLFMSVTTMWTAACNWRRRHIGMLPCAPWMNTIRMGDDPAKAISPGDMTWASAPCTHSAASGRGWTGRIDVDAPCTMFANARSDGRTVKIYADVGAGAAVPGEVDTRTAAFTFTKSGGRTGAHT